MNNSRTFPIPFRSLRTMSGGGERSFVVGAMFTAAYADKAERLAASCRKFNLSYVIHEVPSVHRSMSARGTEDLAYTKANFIRNLIKSHRKSILYLDADCEFVAAPELISELVRSACDFAIYNGFDDKYADRFLPVELPLEPDTPDDPRSLLPFCRQHRFPVRKATIRVRSGSILQEFAGCPRAAVAMA